MQVKDIIQVIEQLPLDKRFFVVEQTLKSIKKEELKNKSNISNHNIEEKSGAFIAVSEKSLAKDWLSKEDSRWDNLL